MDTTNAETMQTIADFYGLGKVTEYFRLGGYANKNYRVIAGTKQYVFKLLKEHSQSDARAEVSYAGYAKSYDFSAVEFLKSSNGEPLFTSSGTTALAMPFIEGTKQKQNNETLFLIGTTLAELHSIPLNAILPKRESWLRSEYLPKAIEHIKHKFADADKFTAAYKQSNVSFNELPRSLIHGDLGPENCLVVGDKLVLLDWEEVTIGPSILDLAMTIHYVCFKPFETLDTKLFRALLAGYCSVRQLNKNELKLLPDAVRFSGLTLSAWNKLDKDEWGELYWKRHLEGPFELP